MPDVWVFPGGRVDEGDASAPASSELRIEVAARLAVDAGPRLGRALAMAAARETLEETGLQLGGDDAPPFTPALSAIDYLARAITPSGNPIRYHARFFAVDAAHMGGALTGSEELLDLEWWTFSRALELSIIDVTRMVLGEARAWSEDPDAPRPTAAPLVHYRGARMFVRRAHDKEDALDPLLGP